MRFRPLFLLLALMAASGPAAVARELLPDLTYLTLAEAATAELPADRARVLDARGAPAATTPAPAHLARWLHAPTAPTLLLLDDQPPPWLAATLAAAPARPGRLLTLAAGVYASPWADLTVTTPREADAAARAALADPGADLDQLLARLPAKRRFDEAALVEARQQNPPARRNTPATDPAPSSPDLPPPPADLVLQRAVHLYQGLRALGRW